MKIEGSCHCGRVTYEAVVDPGAVTVCHCTDCQALSGSAYRANIPAASETFVLRGGPKIYIKTADSGNKRAHAFCPDCGSPIYASAPSNPTTYSLRVGSIKQRKELMGPKRQIWCKSALPWSMDINDVPQSPGQ
jgi:hypothetical protein